MSGQSSPQQAPVAPDPAEHLAVVRSSPVRHAAVFYESDAFLAEAVTGFLAPGLADDETALVIATASHCGRFEEALLGEGLDVNEADRSGQLVMLDAHETRDALLCDGTLDPARSRSILGVLVDHAIERGRPVRIYGEIVALLWEEGYAAQALALEDVWNELADSHPFVLLCGYPMQSFVTEQSTEVFRTVCQRHLAISNESYSRLGSPADEGLAVVTLEREWPGPGMEDPG
jgi:hypothetical protein